MLNTLIWGLDQPIAAPLIARLHDEGVFCVKKWIVGESESKTPFFLEREGVEIIEDKIELNFCQDDLDFPPTWLDEKIRHYFPVILQNFAREFFYDRLPVYEFMNIIQIWVRYYYTMLARNQIDAVIFADIPHEGGRSILYPMAQAMGIPTLMLVPSGPFGTFAYCFSIDDYGCFADVPTFRTPHPEETEIRQDYKKDLYYMKGKHAPKQRKTLQYRLRKLASPKAFIKRKKDVFESTLQKYGSIQEFLLKKVATCAMNYDEKKKYQANAMNCADKDVDFNCDYVYFPLHLQPEMTTDVLGGIYCDQLLAIEKLRAMLPPDWMIYVKENPKQTKRMRLDYFFKRLKLIPNVKYVDRSIDTYALMEHAKFVATITGTAGWEAISGGKNALIFGRIWYESFPGVFQYHEGLRLEDITSYMIDHDALEKALYRYLEKTVDAVYSPAVQEAMPAFDVKKNDERLEQFFRFITPYLEEHQPHAAGRERK